MNDPERIAEQTHHYDGRLWLFLGVLVALSGVAIYAIQLQMKILVTPWYAPILATIGTLLVVAALLRSRTVWRWAATGCFTLFAAAQWLMMLVALSAPAYTGTAVAGQPFPDFTTTLANGSAFSLEDFKGDQSTVLLFFRGRW